MAPIYDFPRAARAEHGHGAKKVLAGVRFQWTDTQNDICIGRADKFSGWEPLLEPSKPFLLKGVVFELYMVDTRSAPAAQQLAVEAPGELSHQH